MARPAVILFGMLLPFLGWAQGGDQQLRAKADALFNEKRFAEAMPMYSQLVSLTPSDRDLNYRFGTCLLFGGADKEKAIGHLKYATEAPSTDPRAWYWLGRAYHLNYHFREAQAAYQRFLGTDDKKAIAELPVDALQKQCRNGEELLNNLKEITVRNKVEVDDKEFFRFYDLSDIGGKIVVLPEELKSSLDKKSKERTLVYLPERGGPIYFSSYGKDGKTGRDIYRTELMPEGTFAPPVKLAGYINTDQDEDYPFMHPDGKTFYFSSKGHNSMGGYDVFRAPYDRGLDAFGRPENLDFAVNTPDDDIFYLVDPEGKEACFASARSSRQGQVHVYRVGTAQLPLVITVLKGTYASEFDASDRKAHIMVEDALTGEQVADVRTDLNGGYVLSLPRSGRYRYKVECGPTGKTHGGIVEVPRTDSPRAYRQELSLVRNGDLEKLEIRNYFDTPLDDDLVALALDEIKRRARLDVTGDRPVAPMPAETPKPAGDLLTQAGFSGDIDEQKALQLAKDDAAELERTAGELEIRSQEAFSLALEATTEAERTAKQAVEQLAAAADQPNEEERNTMMVEAARTRQRSREATLRAKAAYSTGVALGNEATAARQQAATAQRLSTDLQATMAAKRDSETLVHLTALKQRMDTRSGPEGGLDATEKARRALSAQEKEAARLLNIANGKRAEENELADRLNRLKREQAEAKGKARKDELQRQIDEVDGQLVAQRRETEMAFTKARAEEKRTAVLRGQTSLTGHLSTNGGREPVSEVTATQITSLGQRIEGTEKQVEAMPIDERFDAQIAVNGTEVEARTFDWDLVSAAGGIGEQPRTTDVMARNTTADARQQQTRTTSVSPTGTGARTVQQAGQVQVEEGADRTADADTQEVAGQVQPSNERALTQRTDQGQRAAEAGAAGVVVARTEQQVDAPITAGAQVDAAGSDAQNAQEGTRFMLENQRDELRQLVQAERNRARKDSLQGALTRVDQQLAALDAQAEVAAAGEPEDTSAEESLDDVPVDPARTPLLFDREASAQEILPLLYADYARDKTRLQTLPDADERAAGLNGLELMMADSIRAEMARQVKLLELAPQRAEEILPRVARLRELRNEQLHLADQHLKDRQDELAAAGAMAQEVAPSQVADAGGNVETGQDPINDRFVALTPYATDVYAIKLEHRASTVDDAVAFKEADLARIDDLTTRIDSMEAALADAPRDRSYDRMRKETDRLIDERLIIRTDLGQRSAFLTKEEWKAATDSIKVLDKAITTKGFAPTEPLLIMAQDLRNAAQAEFDKAAQLRKRADRIEDIQLRDSLYRSAYRTELEALHQIDRSITVRAYLVSEEHQRGETLAYEAVAERMFGTPAVEPGSSAEVIAQTAPTERRADIDSTSSTNGPERVAPEVGVAARTTQAERPDSTATTTATEVAQAQPQPAAGQDAGRPVIAPAPVVQPITAAGGADVQQARAEAERIAAEAERKLPAQQRSPVALYERFLSAEAGTLTTLDVEDPAMDPALLTVKAESARRLAAEQEQEALRSQDLAAAYADSATTARKRDRERLERMAVRARAAADSLQTASLASAREARELELAAKEAEASIAYRQRLIKYYYLNGEEQALVIDSADHSRYFQARTRALEQYDAADEAARAASGNREVAELLRAQARTAEMEASNGRLPAAVAVERMSVLDRRADALMARADSLDDVAARLRGAAAINEAQAGVMLQGMRADRSTDIMALEMRTRRTEPMLAGTRGPLTASGSSAQSRQQEAAAGGSERGAEAGAGQQQVPNAQNGAAVVRASEQAQVAAQPVAGTERPAAGTEAVPERTAGAAPVVREVAPAERMGTRTLPEVLVSDIFQMQPAATRREEPIPMDLEMPQGIVFKVQIGAFRNEVPQEAFSDMTPVMGETVGNGLVRYTAGLFTGFDQAASAKDQVRARGYRDAFVVAYRDGQRIPLGEAMRVARAQQAQATVERPADTVLEPVARQEAPAPVAATIQPAPPPAPVTAAEETARILERYPPTAEAIVDAFAPSPDATSYYAGVPNAAPARQVETIKGLFFTVQVGVYSKPVPLDKLFNITPLNSELTETQKVRYTTGIYLDLDKARTRKDEAVGLGVKDAFITAYLNGRRIPMREATALLEKFGPAILARP
jgi:hypothetical protein